MREIILTNGLIAFVDDEDYERIVAAGPWYADKRGSTWYVRQTKRTHQYMHRLVLLAPLVDHIDRNGLNNQKCNLRLATPSLNACNSRGRGTGRYKGVSYHRTRRYWEARLELEGKMLFRARFDNEADAARAYNAAALKHAGEFAYLNDVA